MSKLIKILDIDLDFFLNNRHIDTFDNSQERLNEEDYIPWDASEVKEFIEKQCLITHPIPGRVFTTHDEVFYALREIVGKSTRTKFIIDHIDAHADLGMGGCSFIYILGTLLGLPVEDRLANIPVTDSYRLNEGNFLAYAIACRMIQSLRYVNNLYWATDVPFSFWKNHDSSSSAIQLKLYNRSDLTTGMSYTDWEVLGCEPEIPFSIVDYTSFKGYNDYDYLFLTQSPRYTPSTSDKMIPIISKYISQ